MVDKAGVLALEPSALCDAVLSAKDGGPDTRTDNKNFGPVRYNKEPRV